MLINSTNLRELDTQVQLLFNRGLQRTVTPWQSIAMQSNSTTAENLYPLFKELGGIREWLGDRVIQNVERDGFRLVNRDWEATWGIDRNHVLDDSFGTLAPMFEMAGQEVASFPSEKAYGLLRAGHETLGPDGQFFFDTDHPLASGVGSNDMGGTTLPVEQAWYLIDESRVFKPVIYQLRQSFNLVRMFNPDDHNVFFLKKYIWGVDGRAAFGFSPFWQLAMRSRQALDETNVKAAMVAMNKQRNHQGKPIGAAATTIVVHPEQGELARDLFSRELIASGGAGVTNTLRNRLRVVVAHELL
ncbi:MAG: Mu-like prophage major head subunit gpT family protein [Rubrivivax sp.]|nr:Mu-like prophage major head subunit gpT family protein [Rubrivivax sp.]